MKRPSTGTIILGIILVLFIFSYSSNYEMIADVHPELASLGPGADRWLGTDPLGRDVAWRLVFATRAFVLPGALAALTAALLGVPMGALAAWLGGPAASALRLVLGSVAAIPRFALLLVICSIYGDYPGVLGLACGLAAAPALAEAVYSRVGALVRAELVIALRAHGLSNAVILGRHLLWLNCRVLVGRGLLEVFAFTIASEATLSYIGGYGVSEPNPSWGNMLAFEFGIHDGNPLAVLAPAAALWLGVLGLGLSSGVRRG